MKWRSNARNITLAAPGFIEPCVPTLTKTMPRGAEWLFELKLDGYRLMVRKSGSDVRIYSRNGADFTTRYPRIVSAARMLRATSAVLDGEGIVYDQDGMPDFSLIHSKERDRQVSLVAFDLLEKNGQDLRPLPLSERKRRLQHLLKPIRRDIEFAEHIEGSGHDIFVAACRLGHEGIVAKRKDTRYESGRSRFWLKLKNPNSPAMARLRDE